MSNDTSQTQKSLLQLQATLEGLQKEQLPARAAQELDEALNRLAAFNIEIGERTEQRRLAALYKVSQMLSDSLNLDDVLQTVMDAVLDLTGASRGFLMLRDERSNALELVVGRGLDKADLSNTDMKISDTVIEMVLDSGDALVTTNAQEDPRLSTSGSVSTFALRSIMCAPLLRANNKFGVIYVDNQAKAGLFDEADLALLNAFAGQASVAIDNARLYTQTDEHLAARVNELENLARINRELSKQSTLIGVAEIAHDWASAGSDAQQAWVALKANESDDAFKIIAGDLAGKEIQLDDPTIAVAIDSGTPHVSSENFSKQERIVVPLRVENEIAGVIVVEGMGAFDSTVLQYLTRLSNLVAVAISRARLAQQVTDFENEQADFLSVVTHELRLPMTSIRGYTDLLRQGAMGAINEQQQQFLDVIRKNVIRMNTLVTGISDTSKIKTGRINLNLANSSLLSLVEQTVADEKEMLEEFKQTVEVSISADLPLVLVDPDRFKQVFGYLLDNAAKYAPENCTVKVGAVKVGDRIKISVKDTGYGITPEDQQQIFEQFYRSEDQRVRDRHGWGVGLTVAHGITALMGGEIGCVSEPDKGSTFWFTVPIASN